MDEVGIGALETRERAPRIVRGTARHLRRLGQVVLTELPLKNGRRADVAGLDSAGAIAIVEVKSGLADLNADHKWPDYLDYCDRFYFAVDADFPRARLPEGAGVIVADSYGAEILMEPEPRPLVPARRKALTLRFARVAAMRLQDLLDPDAQDS